LVPTVLRGEGYRFFFFSNEGNEPPHIHLERGDGYAKFWLDPVVLAEAKDLKNSELRRGKLLVIEHRFDFLERWREYFGA
jgi:Domain of unknown function (DUF4160)